MNAKTLISFLSCAILSSAASAGDWPQWQGPDRNAISKESGLLKASVVLVSQLFTVDKSDLTDHVGTLSKKRVRQILNGIHLVIEPREPNDKTSTS